MRRKFQLIVTTCRRCEKPISTGNRSLYGADEAKAKYNRICSDCVTEQDDYEMNMAIGKAIAERVLKPFRRCEKIVLRH
jgi:superfamily II helicase